MEELRKLRKQKGLTQAKLAVLAGLDPSTLSQIETAARRPNTRTLEKLAGVLGVEVADLFPKGQSPLPLEESAPRTVEELLEAAGVETRWLTLPDEEFRSWWLDVSREEVLRRFWEIEAEWAVIRSAVLTGTQDETRAARGLLRQLGGLVTKLYGRHFGAMAAAPGKDETEEDFYARQRCGEFRQFKPVELESKAREVVALAS